MYQNLLIVYLKKMRTYKRKINRKPLDSETQEQAKQRRVDGESIRAITADMDIEESTLRKRLKVGSPVESCCRFSSTFTTETELELVNYLHETDRKFYGLRFREVQALAYEYAEQNNIAHPFNKAITLVGGIGYMDSFHATHL
ncbi:hypothetical protein PR048_012554 [Dryococelus australis]|uniref:Uncharacterized protein n=1 Tax=Dryococelus australis TaxID=614101 RepID=A0ABQ9HR41_9NEOP|nr:hypothetical protein PR048_012554 [Dryococelus australis]